MTSYKIHLLRTGSTQEGGARQCVGRRDFHLSPSGRAALEQLAAQAVYPPVDRVYCSPLTRCVQSAGILYPRQQPHIADGFSDMNMGEFEGRGMDQLQADESFLLWLQDSQNNPPPGGERPADFTMRAVAALDSTVREMMRERVHSAAIITHGGVIMALMAAAALPRLPLHEWAVANGCGHTLLTNTQLWMQGGCAEAFATLPVYESEESFP